MRPSVDEVNLVGEPVEQHSDKSGRVLEIIIDGEDERERRHA